jgi:hypothetical protein
MLVLGGDGVDKGVFPAGTPHSTHFHDCDTVGMCSWESEAWLSGEHLEQFTAQAP